MDRLTDDLARLRTEIGNLRAIRVSLKKDVRNSVLRNRNSVSAMRKEFRTQHATMAEQSKSERLAFLSRMSKQVSGIRKDTARLRDVFRADILGGRRAWIRA